MLSMSKLLTISLCLTSSLLATSIDDKIIKFEKKVFSKDKRITVKDVKIDFKKELPLEGWTGYVVKITAEVNGKVLSAKDTVFSNGTYLTKELINMKTGQNLESIMVPKLTPKYHDKEKLIAGNHNAKDKIVIFSDPLCPFCIDYVPDVISHVKRNKDSIALYYYHFPLLRLHPAADTLTKLMDVAKHQGIKDIELKTYQADWDEYFTSKTTNIKKIVDAFNKELKTKITLEQVKDSKILEEINKDVRLGEDAMVQGTPTIFINGIKDNTRLKYETLGNN